MSETPVEELLRQIHDTNTPDKSRYARVRTLAHQIGDGIAEPATAESLTGAFRAAYLDLQLALLRSSDDSSLDGYKRQCTQAVSRMHAASRRAPA
ncbi:hypothetical protein [Pararhizobium mangrovi]|uniref:Uncharacterized protein n=1 Tax=Pararhizobium mangrovi TaxID=2590452 RepID=A0A506TY98_9HYPH|nr:hypothetical protein [Pararhizobium mangrovi]TPW27042.1 hypothetical protein FJU11_12940 [Pararhizobium mangrovi]